MAGYAGLPIMNGPTWYYRTTDTVCICRAPSRSLSLTSYLYGHLSVRLPTAAATDQLFRHWQVFGLLGAGYGRGRWAGGGAVASEADATDSDTVYWVVITNAEPFEGTGDIRSGSSCEGWPVMCRPNRQKISTCWCCIGAEPQRTILEKMILAQAADCNCKMVLVRGLPGKRTREGAADIPEGYERGGPWRSRPTKFSATALWSGWTGIVEGLWRRRGEWSCTIIRGRGVRAAHAAE